MADQFLAGIVRHHALVALHLHELDVIQDVFERLVALAERAERLVEHAAVRLGGVAQAALQVGPSGTLGHEESVVVVGVLAVLRLRSLLDHALLDLAADDLFAFGVEYVGATLQE